MIAIDNKYMTSAAESLYLSNSDENVRKVALEREEFLRFQAFREKKIELLEEQIDNLNGQVDNLNGQVDELSDKLKMYQDKYGDI